MSLACLVSTASAQMQAPNIWSIQLDGGVFVLNETGGISPGVGMRYCKHYNPHLYGGLLTGFTYNEAGLQESVGDTPSGASHIEIARTEARMIPVMGFMQVNITSKFFLVPYVGIGAGYEWLSLRSVDRRSGQDSTLTYGNIAWQGYGGIGIRIAKGVRLNGEVFYNGGSLERSALAPDGTTSYREAVHVNGVGARFGIDTNFE